jgi:hypothetical protein
MSTLQCIAVSLPIALACTIWLYKKLKPILTANEATDASEREHNAAEPTPLRGGPAALETTYTSGRHCLTPEEIEEHTLGRWD